MLIRKALGKKQHLMGIWGIFDFDSQNISNVEHLESKKIFKFLFPGGSYILVSVTRTRTRTIGLSKNQWVVSSERQSSCSMWDWVWQSGRAGPSLSASPIGHITAASLTWCWSEHAATSKCWTWFSIFILIFQFLGTYFRITLMTKCSNFSKMCTLF